MVGRNTQGVRLIRLGEGERLTGIERIESLGEDARARDPVAVGAAVRGSVDNWPCRHADVLIYFAPRAITSGANKRSGNKVRTRG